MHHQTQQIQCSHWRLNFNNNELKLTYSNWIWDILPASLAVVKEKEVQWSLTNGRIRFWGMLIHKKKQNNGLSNKAI